MATRTVRVCDWHNDPFTAATHHNVWTNPRGEVRENDLCDDHQEVFERAWQAVESGSSKAKKRPAAKGRASARDRRPDSQLIRAWAAKEGLELSAHGRIPYHIERRWIEEGRPNVLDDGPKQM